MKITVFEKISCFLVCISFLYIFFFLFFISYPIRTQFVKRYRQYTSVILFYGVFLLTSYHEIEMRVDEVVYFVYMYKMVDLISERCIYWKMKYDRSGLKEIKKV